MEYYINIKNGDIIELDPNMNAYCYLRLGDDSSCSTLPGTEKYRHDERKIPHHRLCNRKFIKLISKEEAFAELL